MCSRSGVGSALHEPRRPDTAHGAERRGGSPSRAAARPRCHVRGARDTRRWLTSAASPRRAATASCSSAAGLEHPAGDLAGRGAHEVLEGAGLHDVLHDAAVVLLRPGVRLARLGLARAWPAGPARLTLASSARPCAHPPRAGRRASRGPTRGRRPRRTSRSAGWPRRPPPSRPASAGPISDSGARSRVQATGVGRAALVHHGHDGLADAEAGDHLAEVVVRRLVG